MNSEQFVPFTSFFWGLDTIRSEFSSYAALINAANAIINCYDEMHSNNIFGGIDDECIKINPDSGEVKIQRKSNNVSLKYKAPELITGVVPDDNIDTDNFTLGVLLFRLFFADHPFEGRNSLATAPFVTEKMAEVLYGEQLLFVYSPTDKSNRPLSNLSPYLTSRWNKTPQSLKDAFTQNFTDGIKNIKSRFSIQQWKELIITVMDTGVFANGQLYLINPDNLSTLPPECVIIKIDNRKIALSDGGKLIVSYGETTTPLCANVFVQNGINILTFENITDDTWIIYKSDGSEKYIQPNEKAYLVSGDCIDFGSETGQVI